MNFFTMPDLDIDSYWKKLKEPIADDKWYSGICWYCQMTLQTDPFVSPILQKYNWNLIEQLVKGSYHVIS